MTALRFVLRFPPPMRLDLSPLIPERLARMEASAIDRIELGSARASVRVGDVFRLQTGEASRVTIEGGSERFDFLGAEMSSGEVLLDGEAGYAAGRRMAGGRLEIRGDAGGWAGSGLRGGTVEIWGDAGAMLGAPFAGERAGMAGGTLIVRGGAGERAGDRMRRGLIIIEGAAGVCVGSRMLAGTLVVCGAAGAMPGYLMRRGTLLLGLAAPLPTFVPTGNVAASFRGLLAGALARFSWPAAQLAATAAERYLGDVATLGKGEMVLGTTEAA